LIASGATAGSPDRYFAQVHGAYERAAQQCERITVDLGIGPWPLRVSFASRELARTLMQPLLRLLSPSAVQPLGTILAWDSGSTRVRIPPFPFSAVRASTEIDGFNTARFRATYREDGLGFHALSLFDSARRIGLVWFARHDRIHWYERAEPLRAPIHWALTTDRRLLLHASAVGDTRGAVLLTGKGGSGKTTTTLSSLDIGLQFVGDNYVVLSLEDEPTAYGLYSNAKLWPETLERLPQFKPFAQTLDVSSDEKVVVDVARYRPDATITGLPIRAVVVPEITGSAKPRLIPCSGAEALLALAPTTILQLPTENGRLAGMAELVRRVPTYTLKLADDLVSGPRVLSDLLDELAA
jgi:hypothetical protein